MQNITKNSDMLCKKEKDMRKLSKPMCLEYIGLLLAERIKPVLYLTKKRITFQRRKSAHIHMEKIDKKMREEIIPEMLKNVSSMKNIRFGFEVRLQKSTNCLSMFLQT